MIFYEPQEISLFCGHEGGVLKAKLPRAALAVVGHGRYEQLHDLLISTQSISLIRVDIDVFSFQPTVSHDPYDTRHKQQES